MELYNNKGDFQLEMVKDRSKVNVTFNFEMFIDENNEFKIKIWSNKYKKFNYEERLTSDLMHCILFNKCDFNKYKSYYTNYKYENVDINNINDLIKCNYEYDIYEEWDEVYKPKTILIDKKVELIDYKHMIKLTFRRKNNNITINIPTSFILLNKNFIKKYFKDRFNDIVIDNIECELDTIFDDMILLFKIDDNMIGSATQKIKVNVGGDIINKVYNFLHNNNFFEIIKN